jgi:Helix-turn-helix domain
MAEPDEMLDVRRAAALARRHPETIRRWVWTGRLAARRQGNRLLVSRGDVAALAGEQATTGTDLAAWAESARQVRESTAGTHSRISAADLVIEDRTERSGSIDGAPSR